MLISKVYGLAFSVVALLLSTALASQEQWQLDQAAGKYWYVEENYVYTYDPKENNPGTLVVIPLSDGSTDIRVFPDLEFGESGQASVRYAFNKRLEGSDVPFIPWSTVQLRDGYRFLDAPPSFIEDFGRYAQDDGFVEMEIIDESVKTHHRTFILDSYPQALAEVMEPFNPVTEITDVLGQWKDDIWGEGTTLTLTESQGSFIAVYNFSDGSVHQSKLTEVPYSNGRRFNQDEDESEWYILRNDGRLELHNAEGPFRTLELK